MKKNIFFIGHDPALLSFRPGATHSGHRNGQTGMQPMPGTHMVIENTILSGCRPTVSGEFSFQGLKKGRYTLKVSHIGFQTVKVMLQLVKDTAISYPDA